MRKLFLSLFAALLIYGSVQSVSASTVTHVTSFGDSPYIYSFDDGATYYFNNSPFGSGTAYHPVAYLDNGIYWFMGKFTRVTIGGNVQALNSVYYNGSNGNTIGSRSANSILSQHRSISFDGLPCFNNLNDAVNYAKNLSYNANNIIAGTIPATYTFSSNTDFQPKIVSSSYGYLFNLGVDRVLFNPLLSFVPLWADFSARYGTQFTFTAEELPQIPNYQKSELSIFLQLPSPADVSAFVAEYGFDINSPLFIAQINAFAQQHNSFRWINTFTYSSKKIPGEFIRDTLDITDNFALAGSNIINTLISQYGSETNAVIAFYLLGRIYSVSLVDYGFNSSTNVYTAYPAGQYYYDKLFYDGSLYQKRSISVNVPPNTGSSAPTYENPSDPSGYSQTGTVIGDEISKNYTDLINQNNGNNEFNIYIDNVNDRLDSWFEDGDLNVDENISDVFSLMRSVSHIGSLFGALLSGFFPAYVVALFGFAFALIPIILIIKLII